MSVHKLTHVREIADLRHVVHWARRLPLFDSADRNRGGNVEITYCSHLIATVACASAALAYAAEMICTSVIIKREDGWLPLAFPPTLPAKRRRASSLAPYVINMRMAS
jgi:hypothetical protein